jgi:hypothetical protein
MFRRPTLFVIGAGAGADVNMPIGARLSDLIAGKTDIRFEGGYNQISGDPTIMAALRRIAKDRRAYLRECA